MEEINADLLGIDLILHQYKWARSEREFPIHFKEQYRPRSFLCGFKGDMHILVTNLKSKGQI